MLTARWRALGTSVVVAVTDPATLASACDAVVAQVEALDAACSRFRADSDLSRLNAAAGTTVVVSPLLAEAIHVALRAARLTEGDVDPTVGACLEAIGYDRDFDSLPAAAAAVSPRPAAGWATVRIAGEPPLVTLPAGARLDLGATAKALGADRAARAAAAACGGAVLVSLGGDVATAGGAPGDGWPVLVTDDHAARECSEGQLIRLTGGGLATSSTTVRHWSRGGAELHHVVDPRTGAPVTSPHRTVTVAAATCVDANTASTAALVRGTRAVAWLESTGLPARLVAQDGTVTRLNGWPAAAEVAA